MSKLTLSAALLASTLDGLNLDGKFDCPGLHLANDSRFIETHFSEPLTTYAVGWRDPNNIEATLDFLAPAVPVGRKFEFKKATNAEEFLSETVDDLRAIGSDFKRVQYSGTDAIAKTFNRGLTEIVDLDNVTGTSWEQESVARLQRRLLRNSVRRAFAGLTAAATNTNKVWGSSADPDQDVMDDLVTATTASGIRPNRVLYGDSAWNLRRKSFRAQNNAGADASARLKPSDLAADLMVDQVMVSTERYQSAAATKTEIAGLKQISFYADSMANTQDPSNIKRFITLHDANQGGGRWMVYRQQMSAKLVSITVAHYENIIITSTLGIRQITASAS
jgi:hypothetical protein